MILGVLTGLNQAKILSRDQLKKVLGGDGPNDVLCYCASPLTPTGAYEKQWISDGCTAGRAKVVTECGNSANGDCGACGPISEL